MSKDIDKVLTVLKLSGRLPIASAFEIADSLNKFGWNHKNKAAIVDLNPESLQSNEFGKIVAMNRGYNVKAFDNEKDAIDWPTQ